MKSYALFQEYIWLVETIHQTGQVKLRHAKYKQSITDSPCRCSASTRPGRPLCN